MSRSLSAQPFHRCLTAALLIAGLSLPPFATANPLGEVVMHGDVQFERSDGYLRVLQSSDRAIINWESFSINAGDLTEFVQPGSTSAVLNKVRGSNASVIEGMLKANGVVYLLNSNGILIGPNGSVDVGGFVGSTLDVGDHEFRNGGNLNFAGPAQAAIVNLGSISAMDGDVILIAASVKNAGTIRAPQGTAALAAGNDVLLAESGSERIFVRGASGGTKAEGVSNSGSIEANIAELKAHGGNIYGMAVKNEGRVAATGVTKQGGQIFLSATGGKIRSTGTLSAKRSDGSGGRVKVDSGAEGKTEIGGTVDTSGETGKGGEIVILGREIEIFEGSLILNDGETGGGNTYVGGGLRGEDPGFLNAENVVVGAGAVFRADARAMGNGGQVVFFAEDTLEFGGEVSVRGGTSAGDGGFVELSGKNELYVDDLVRQIKVSSASGLAGTLLIDPINVSVTNGVGGGVVGTSITDGAINTWLSTGNLVINTAGSGGDGDITFAGNVNVTWNSGNSLSFVADRDFIVNGGAVIHATGAGSFDVTATRAISIGNGASLTTTNGNLTLSANAAGTTTGNFIGVDVNGGLVRSLGSGSVSVTGKGGNDAGGSQHGVQVRAGGSIVGGSAPLTVTGLGGPSSSGNNNGIKVTGLGSSISSLGGSVLVHGTGGGGSSGGSTYGVSVDSSALIGNTGTGIGSTVTVRGYGSAFATFSSNHGVLVFLSGSITSSGGPVLVEGTGGGTGSSVHNYGVYVPFGGSITSSGTGAGATVTVNGIGGNAGGSGTFNYGVFVNGMNSKISSSGGSIAVTGVGTNNSEAVRLEDSGAITSVLNANVTITGDSLNIITSGAINSGSGTTSIMTRTSGTFINLGGADVLSGSPLTLGLTDAELDRITAGTVQIGNSNSGEITVSSAITHSNHLSLTTGAGVAINNAITMAVNKNLTIDALGTVNLATANADLSASGTGTISLTTARDISFASGSSAMTANGALSLSANAAGTHLATFDAIDINGGTVQVTGSGNLTLIGKGGLGGGADPSGIVVRSGGAVIGGTSGLVSITGTGGSGTSNNTGSSNLVGVLIDGTNSRITSASADVQVTGIGGTSSGAAAGGVLLINGGMISAGGNGSVVVTGTGGAGTFFNYGVDVVHSGSIISSTNGAVTVNGTGGIGAGGDNWGVLAQLGGKITAGGSNDVNVTGIGGSGAGGNNHGVVVRVNIGGLGTITSGGGNVTVTGTAGTGGSGNLGINVQSGGTITTATNGGTITLVADKMDIADTVATNSSGTVTLVQKTSGVAIILGSTVDTTAGTLELSDAELDRITAGTLQIGNAGSGAITVSGAVSPVNVTILSLTTGGALGGSGSLTVEKLALSAAHGIGSLLSPLHTAVSHLEAFGGTGGIFVANTGDLSVGDVSTGLIGLSATDADIVLTAASSITVAEDVSGGTGGVTLEATEDIIVSGDVQISSTGGGAISLTAARSIALQTGSSITTADGALTLSANQQVAPTPGNFVGVDVTNALIQSSGSGNVTISGRGGDTDEENDGVRITGISSVSVNTGLLSITGVAGGDLGNGVNVRDFDGDAPLLAVTGAGSLSIFGTGVGGADGITLYTGSNGIGGSDATSVTIESLGGNLALESKVEADGDVSLGSPDSVLIEETVKSGSGHVTVSGNEILVDAEITAEGDLTFQIDDQGAAASGTVFVNAALSHGGNLSFQGGDGSGDTVTYAGFNDGPVDFYLDNLTGIENLIGSRVEEDHITGPAAGALFSFIGPDSFTVSGVSVSAFENVTGGLGNDTFAFVGATSALSGKLAGGGGVNKLDYSAYGAAISVHFETSAATGIRGGNDEGFSEIDEFIGQGGISTFTGLNAGTVYTVTGQNDFTFGAFTVTDFANLSGGSGDDRFQFQPGASFTGVLDGGLGTNELSYLGFGSNVTVNFETSTASAIGGGYLRFTKFEGSSGSGDSFVGPNDDTTYQITAANTFETTALEATGFENLTGGTGDDAFLVAAGGSLAGQLSDGGGVGTLDYSSYGSSVTVNIGSGSATGFGGISGFDNFIGSTSADTLIATGGNDVFEITTDNGGTLNDDITFTAFEILHGGAGDDRFHFRNQAIVALVDGGLNNDTFFLDDSNLVGGFTYTITASTITRNPVYNFVNIETLELLLGSGDDTVNSNFFPFAQILDAGPGYNTLNIPTVTNLDGGNQIGNVTHLRFAAPRTLQTDPGGGGPSGPPNTIDTEIRFNTGGSAMIMQQLAGNGGGFSANPVIAQGVVFALDGNSTYMIFRAVSLDGSGLTPSDVGAAALSENLSIDANVELAQAINFGGIVLLYLADGPYALDLSGAPVNPAVIEALNKTLATDAALELFQALEMAFVVGLTDADGASAILFDGAAPGEAVLAILLELLSDAAFAELSAALADGN